MDGGDVGWSYVDEDMIYLDGAFYAAFSSDRTLNVVCAR